MSEQSNNQGKDNKRTIPKIKICGLRTEEDVRIVNQVVPEYCGFIFVPTRKRYIEPEKAEHLRKMLDPRIRPVGVFVNLEPEEIMKVLGVCHIDMVQLHGQETDLEIEKLRKLWQEMSEGKHAGEEVPKKVQEPDRRELTIVKAFRIDSERDVRQAERSSADRILLDHGVGGTGETFDWSLIRNCRRRFFLAGGLSADNVGEAICLAHPWGVDVSSSLETDGHKDLEKARRFVQVVRG